MAFEGGLHHEEHPGYRDPQPFQRPPAERLSGEMRLLRMDLLDKGVDLPDVPATFVHNLRDPFPDDRFMPRREEDQ